MHHFRYRWEWIHYKSRQRSSRFISPWWTYMEVEVLNEDKYIEWLLSLGSVLRWVLPWNLSIMSDFHSGTLTTTKSSFIQCIISASSVVLCTIAVFIRQGTERNSESFTKNRWHPLKGTCTVSKAIYCVLYSNITWKDDTAELSCM